MAAGGFQSDLGPGISGGDLELPPVVVITGAAPQGDASGEQIMIDRVELHAVQPNGLPSHRAIVGIGARVVETV